MSSVLKWGSKKAGKPQFQESGSGKTWLHPAESLQQGSVVYSVKFLGLTDVAQAKGTEIVREAIKKVKFANHIKKSESGVKGSKLKKVEIKISIHNIKVEDAKMKEPLYSYPLHRISYCADDKRDKKLFAFIAKDSGAQHHSCYVFECDKMAEELTLTVGQAFDLAYRRFLEKKAVNQNSNKKLTEMEEKIKTAEEEKEALKQKIAELEVASRQGPPSSNGSNEGSQSQSDIDEFDLLGSFGSITTMPGPLPQEALPQETTSGMQEAFPQETTSGMQEALPQEMAGHEMIFDPFAESPSQPQTAAPVSPDINDISPQPVTRPTAKGLGLLPPPPTKQSVKAANRLKSNSGNVTGVTSHTGVISPTTTTPPTLSPAPSDDLLQLGTGSAASFSRDPFSSGINGTNPFSDHLFDPLASKDPFLDGGKEINQNIQGFSSDLVLH